MKKWNSALIVLLTVCVLNSCSKSTEKLPAPTEGEASNSFAKAPSTRLKSMSNSYSTLRFYYDREGGLDSIIITIRDKDYDRFIMHGKGKFTESIERFYNNELVAKWDSIKYNTAGRLSEYTRRTIGWPGMYRRYLLEYDKNGDLSAQRMQTNSGEPVENFYEYNQDHDLVANRLYVGDLEHPYTFRGDNNLNPLYQMDMMYIILEYLDDQRLMISKHNLTEMRFVSGTTWQYLNDYDEYGRLIKRTNVRHKNYYTFTYF